MQPAEIDSTEVTISVEACTVDIANFASFASRCYCHNGACTVPGPTLVIRPGSTLTVTFVNGLGSYPDQSHTMNTMLSPNTVNLHTHGLHVDPAVDSIFVEVEPGESHTYAYEIPEAHAAGFHWYHSHLHGSSTFQARR